MGSVAKLGICNTEGASEVTEMSTRVSEIEVKEK